MNSGSNGLLERLQSLEGNVVGTSRWILMSQATIDRFGEATGDEQWIHVDRARAEQESPFGTTVAHGMLTLSLAPALAIELLGLDGAKLVINYGLDRVRFPAPVPAGSRVRMQLELSLFEPQANGARLRANVSFEVENGPKPACVAELILVVQP